MHAGIPEWGIWGSVRRAVQAADDVGINVVADFGAVGDGATDDSEAIQAALDAADEGDAVFVPPGVFIASVRIKTAGVTLTGPGCLKTPPNATSGINEVPVRVMADGVTVDGIEVDGNKANNPAFDGASESRKADGIAVYASDVTVRNCRIHDLFGHGIIAWTEGFSEGGDTANSLPRHRLLFDSNRLWNGTHRAMIDVVSLPGKSSQFSTVSNNRVYSSGSNGITLHKAFMSSVYGNQVWDVNDGIHIHDESSRVTVWGNMVQDASGYAVAVRNGAQMVRILGNPRLHGDTGLYFADEGDHGNPTDVTVRDNIIDADTTAISYESATGLRIIDNTIDGSTVADYFA